MACTSCASGGCSTPTGCQSNGGCQSGSCNKFNSFDWLSNMSLPGIDLFDVVEIRFKGGRKEFFRNNQQIFLTSGDPVVVEMPNGHHIGYVALQGELVRLQMKKKKVSEDSMLPSIYRKATPKDLERFEEVRKREMPTMFRTRQIVEELSLKMKLSDVEFQADNTKATFYYSADDRVDFRELIKVLAGEFKIRVEMRQISLRQEASRVGGIGSCGRELCCSTWLSDFRTVATSAARYQNLSLNPSKLSGQCGRLKCCLNYELETYQDALLDIPEVKDLLVTEQGEAQLQKVDIFKKILWFSLGDDNNWYPVESTRVQFIMQANKKGLMPRRLMSAEMSSSKEFKTQAAESRRMPHQVSKTDVDPNELIPIGASMPVRAHRAHKPDADLQELERLEALERREVEAVQQEAGQNAGGQNRQRPQQRQNERPGNDRRPQQPQNRPPRGEAPRQEQQPRGENRRPQEPRNQAPRPERPAEEGNKPRQENRPQQPVNKPRFQERRNPDRPPRKDENIASEEVKKPISPNPQRPPRMNLVENPVLPPTSDGPGNTPQQPPQNGPHKKPQHHHKRPHHHNKNRGGNRPPKSDGGGNKE